MPRPLWLRCARASRTRRQRWISPVSPLAFLTGAHVRDADKRCSTYVAPAAIKHYCSNTHSCDKRLCCMRAISNKFRAVRVIIALSEDATARSAQRTAHSAQRTARSAQLNAHSARQSLYSLQHQMHVCKFYFYGVRCTDDDLIHSDLSRLESISPRCTIPFALAQN